MPYMPTHDAWSNALAISMLLHVRLGWLKRGYPLSKLVGSVHTIVCVVSRELHLYKNLSESDMWFSNAITYDLIERV